MSAQLFDLGRRLRAADEGRPVLICTTSLHQPATDPVIVHLEHSKDDLQTTLTHGGQQITGTASTLLADLATLGIQATGPNFPTLVVATSADLTALVDVARKDHPTRAEVSAAHVIGWWHARSEHPASGAVIVLTRALSQRYTLGTPPKDQRDLATWIQWLGVPNPDPTTAMATLTALARHGHTNPQAPTLFLTDTKSWAYAVREHDKGHDWRKPDTFAKAALGLTTRCDSSELADSLHLDDPAVALRASFTGDTITGTIIDTTPNAFTLHSPRALSRLRPGTKITGWVGNPDNINARLTHDNIRRTYLDAQAAAREAEALAEASGDVRDKREAREAREWARELYRAYKASDVLVVSSGVIASVSMQRDESLRVEVEDVVLHPRGPLCVGEVVTLRPARVVPAMQQQRRRKVSEAVHKQGNWVAGRGLPLVPRRAVPLAITVAAADD